MIRLSPSVDPADVKLTQISATDTNLNVALFFSEHDIAIDGLHVTNVNALGKWILLFL
jgi:hypothetical protein